MAKHTPYQALANARLIALAPELLEGIEAAIHELRVRCFYGPGYAIYDQLQALYEKATGSRIPA